MSAFDIAGTVFSVIGLVGILQQIYQFVYGFFPAAHLRILDETLTDAGSLYHTAVEENLLEETPAGRQIPSEMERLRREAERLRAKVRAQNGIFGQWREMRAGLSATIRSATERADRIRAEITSAAEEAREIRTREQRQTRVYLIPPHLYDEIGTTYADSQASGADDSGGERSGNQVLQASAIDTQHNSLLSRGSTVPPSTTTFISDADAAPFAPQGVPGPLAGTQASVSNPRTSPNAARGHHM
ncbi:hypothetical protein PHLGIDRAFT_29469 [Phlebiopsis gigantea 11061_1 CR5-6]|uniref:Uncharacterized protein n=1 Tax=Phlebiopsis gigantea (strain 11061_1 CR5-6) TaxID=745531 RepID=A0A0C3SCB8_PHLG1|nr:hypothetical protein PHLGIDRAFT_29469 [Phlebiopsis gigantea 11061_1 CR5-6]